MHRGLLSQKNIPNGIKIRSSVFLSAIILFQSCQVHCTNNLGRIAKWIDYDVFEKVLMLIHRLLNSIGL